MDIESSGRCASVLATTAYVSLFAQLGAASRILIGELFAGNCSERSPDGDLNWIPCVASNGGDQSYGGALFKDLAANMAGCFIIGLLSSGAALKMVFPSLTAENRPVAAVSGDRAIIQQNSALQVGLRTGFCGSLTTFASWKLQMVQMLLAGAGAYYESQWLGVGMGLILGTMSGLAALAAGQHVAVGMLKWSERSSKEKEHSALEEKPERNSFPILTFLVALLCMAITGGTLFGVCIDGGTSFWRRFYASMLLAPFGAVTRWQLSSMNGTGPWTWFPIGTFCANALACIISFTSQGIDTRWSVSMADYRLLLFALRTGLAGSLSTVSTWVVEIQKLMSKPETLHKGYAYVLFSQVMAIGLGVVIYGTFLWA